MMDLNSAMENFAEAWVAAHTSTSLTSTVDQQGIRATNTTEETCTDEDKDPSVSKACSTRSVLPPAIFNNKQVLAQLMVGNGSSSSLTGKSIPIHCVVEQIGGSNDVLPKAAHSGPAPTVTRTHGHNTELDTFAIVPGSTLFSDLVRTALVKIGYSASESLGAKGSIQLKHWKALTFESITENPDSTVEQILGDVTSVATLRIRLCRYGSSRKSQTLAVEDMKEKLLQFLIQHSQGMLTSLGCPIEKGLLSQLCQGEYGQSLPEETREAFNRWYRDQTKLAANLTGKPNKGLVEDLLPKQLTERKPSHIPEGLRMGVEAGLLGPHGNSKVRLRTSFDADHEIPRLQKWFSQNHHPSREQMVVYLNELNSLESRKGRKPLDLTNIIYWFKNARAAQRRSSCLTPSKSEGAPSPESPDVDGDLDMDMEADTDESPREEDRLSTSSQEHVPELPNRNAVYVVQPLPPAQDEKYEIVHFNEEENSSERPVLSPHDYSGRMVRASSMVKCEDKRSEGDENHNKCLVMEQQEEATDLSMRRSRRNSTDSGLHSSHDSTSMKLKLSSASVYSDSHLKRSRDDVDDEDDDDEPYHSSCSSNTSSPRLPGNSLVPRDLGVKSPAISHASTHLASHFHHQHALQIAAMSHAFNMQYMHPASLYGVDASPLAGVGAPSYKDDDGSSSNGMDSDRKKRSRVFIDPLTEIPKLEKWFMEDTHPSSYMIEKYTEELNRSSYRQRFPKLEPKNVQLWFKNHRAKVKRQRLEVPC